MVFLSGEIMSKKYICFFMILLCLSMSSSAAQEQGIDTALAERYFQEARAICARDQGELWGVSLYGPMMLVDRNTRMIVANQSDAEGRLRKKGDVFVGRLPDEENIANTATSWAGVKWTMIIFPLPGDEYDRAQLMLHELFHRLQAELGFPLANPANNHLDSYAGRYWLQLEWRALQSALTRQAKERRKAIEDALIFRARRHEVFRQATRTENELELNEGLAEYTGVKLRGTTDAESMTFFAKQLREFESRPSFIRSFAYASGPAYGLLLDQTNSHWRKRVKQEGDLAAILAKALAIKTPVGLRQKAGQAAKRYDGDTLFAFETEREESRKKRLAAYRARFVEGAVLALPLTREVGYGFNPNTLEVLDESSTVFPSVRVSDVWGILTVTNGAILTRKEGHLIKVTVCAPTNLQAKPLQGDGWTLELKGGWKLAPGERKGDYTIKQ
jgi:hypothetical protein